MREVIYKGNSPKKLWNGRRVAKGDRVTVTDQQRDELIERDEWIDAEDLAVAEIDAGERESNNGL